MGLVDFFLGTSPVDFCLNTALQSSSDFWMLIHVILLPSGIGPDRAVSRSDSSAEVAAMTTGEQISSRLIERSVRAMDSSWIGIWSRNLSTAQSLDLQVVSRNLLKWSGTMCFLAFAELWNISPVDRG